MTTPHHAPHPPAFALLTPRPPSPPQRFIFGADFALAKSVPPLSPVSISPFTTCQ